MSSPLALLGGTPVLDAPLPPYQAMGEAEVEAVRRVVSSGCLSGFYGSPGPGFMGGPVVRAFEEAWAERFGVRHAVSVNSATSGLFAAMGAVGVSPGDEVILPPYTMSATAMAPLIYGGIPVFVDIEADTFCLDVDAVRAALTPRTRAIVAVNLFGHPAPLHALRRLADERGIFVVEDNAQGPLATEGGRLAGTIGHIGIFSLNFHKHLHTGEGGLCVTDDDRLGRRLQMIRNHGENVVEDGDDLTNLIGFNYRMTEMSAAVGVEQLKRVDAHVGRRVAVAEHLSAGLSDLPGLTVPPVREGCTHVYYVWAMRYDAEAVGVPRAVFSEALAAEGFPHFCGYVAPLYQLPLFQQRRAIGREGFPFTLTDRTYPPGLCPVTERMHTDELIGFEPCAYDLTPSHLEALVDAVRKVHAHREALAAYAKHP